MSLKQRGAIEPLTAEKMDPIEIHRATEDDHWYGSVDVSIVRRSNIVKKAPVQPSTLVTNNGVRGCVPQQMKLIRVMYIQLDKIVTLSRNPAR